MNPAPVIDSFFGEYRFLSNFYPSPMVIDGVSFSCNEQWYVFNKCRDAADQKAVLKLNKPGAMKRFGSQQPVKHNWAEIKLDVMLRGLRAKFSQNADLRARLVRTGTRQLIEGNWWGDTFWGVNYNAERGPVGEGQNHLGRLLMQVRAEFQAEFPTEFAQLN